ncbi:hypothetical protein OG21DRAFT_1011134 [Imleria badia]|nr:hypothetical protein OG21DRAFT_1011134 [Imleria badia]
MQALKLTDVEKNTEIMRWVRSRNICVACAIVLVTTVPRAEERHQIGVETKLRHRVAPDGNTSDTKIRTASGVLSSSARKAHGTRSTWTSSQTTWMSATAENAPSSDFRYFQLFKDSRITQRLMCATRRPSICGMEFIEPMIGMPSVSGDLCFI